MVHHHPTPTGHGKRNALIVAAVVVALVAVVGIGWAIQANRDTTGDDAKTPGQSSSRGASPSPTESTTESGGPTESTTQSGGPTESPSPGAPAAADTYGLGVGDPDAPVKVEIFEDYQCPYCKQFEEASHDKLRQAAESGEAYVVYRPMAFLNDYSGRALNAFGVVLDVSGGEVALAFHDLLFENQPSESGPWPSDDDLVALAVEAGAEEDQVRRGIEQLDFGQWVVNGNDAASKRGVTGTPAVFVNGEQVGGGSMDEITDNILDIIEKG